MTATAGCRGPTLRQGTSYRTAQGHDGEINDEDHDDGGGGGIMIMPMTTVGLRHNDEDFSDCDNRGIGDGKEIKLVQLLVMLHSRRRKQRTQRKNEKASPNKQQLVKSLS